MMEFRINDIDLRSIIVDMVRNCWMIILVMLATYFAIAGVYRLTYSPHYTTTATMAVTARGSQSGTYSSLTTAMNMAEVFSEVFQSDTLKEKIEADLEVDNLDYQISASVISETNLMTLTVTSNTPKMTYQIMQSALDNYTSVSDYLFSNASLQMVQDASVPMSASNPLNYSRIQKLGTLASGVVMIGIIALLSIFRQTVKRSKQAKYQLDGRIITTIPYERKYHSLQELKKKPKKSVLINSPLLSMPYSEANRKLGALIERHMRRRNQQVLLVTSVAENEGKSSIAGNIALSMVDRGKKVVIIDCDFRKPALYKVFELKEVKNGLSDYLDGNCKYEDIITYQNNLAIISQKDSKKNSSNYFLTAQFTQFIKKCRSNFDYIIIDTPPMGACVDVEAIINHSDSSVMVVREDWSEIGAINDLCDVLKQNDQDFIGFILNAFHRSIFSNDSYSHYGDYQRRTTSNLHK